MAKLRLFDVLKPSPVFGHEVIADARIILVRVNGKAISGIVIRPSTFIGWRGVVVGQLFETNHSWEIDEEWPNAPATTR